MTDALVVGDHIVVRSRSDSFVTVNGQPKYAGTRLSVLDKQGKLLSSTDYGFTLAAGYTGEWLMLPSPDGFVMVQASTGTRLLHFDAQANCWAAPPISIRPSRPLPPPNMLQPKMAARSMATASGWPPLSLLPVTDKTQYVLKLCKFDFNGKQLTPPFMISTRPCIRAWRRPAARCSPPGWKAAAHAGHVGQGAGAPTIRSINTGGSQPYPVALNSNGKMGVLWNGKATTTSSGGDGRGGRQQWCAGAGERPH
jgi:hypothetical protein